MSTTGRRDIHLSLTADQADDLISALEAHRGSFERLEKEAGHGFGLPAAYWAGRVQEVQELLDAVRRQEPGDDTGLQGEGGAGRELGQAD